MKATNTKSKSKSKGVQAVPNGFHTITPFLMVSNAQELLDFIEHAFNGKTEYVMKDDEGKITHASSRIGDSPLMLGDVMDGYQPTSAMLYLYVDNVDELYNQAINDAGAKSARELRDEFYGDRAGCVEDKWGNKWWIATHIEDVSEQELQERKSKLLSEEHA
jgi:PhnB protein